MRSRIALGGALVLLLAGCAGSSAVTTTAIDEGITTTGWDLFEERVVGATPGCVTCHSLDEGVVLVGPSLFGLANRAANRVPGLAAEDYVRQSIVDPDAFVVPGFDAGQMQDDWDELLSAQQIDSLVTALLRGPGTS